jgi:hypothetical protein
VIQLYKGLGGGWAPRPVGELLSEEMRETMKGRSDWGGLLDAPLPPPPARPAAPEEITNERGR